MNVSEKTTNTTKTVIVETVALNQTTCWKSGIAKLVIENITDTIQDVNAKTVPKFNTMKNSKRLLDPITLLKPKMK